MSHSATARTDDSSNLVTSDDPSTNASASLGSKLAGDVKGAVQGVVGGAQAALGTTIRNEKMAEEGFEKMRAEDQRLTAKKGKPPVGAEMRNTTTALDPE